MGDAEPPQGGVGAARAGAGARDGVLLLSVTHTHTRARADTPAARPRASREQLPGPVKRRAVGEGAGDTGRPKPEDERARRYLCQRELGCRSHGVSIMHGEGKEGRADRGLGAGRRRRERL